MLVRIPHKFRQLFTKKGTKKAFALSQRGFVLLENLLWASIWWTSYSRDPFHSWILFFLGLRMRWKLVVHEPSEEFFYCCRCCRVNKKAICECLHLDFPWKFSVFIALDKHSNVQVVILNRFWPQWTNNLLLFYDLLPFNLRVEWKEICHYWLRERCHAEKSFNWSINLKVDVLKRFNHASISKNSNREKS